VNVGIILGVILLEIYRTFAPQSHTDYTGDANSGIGEENRGVTLKRSPYIQI